MQNKGFSLIELLVVISIIGILSTIISSSLTSARIKAKDANITQTVQQLRTALEMYYLDNNEYPDSRNGSNWMEICDETNSDLQNELSSYIRGIFNLQDCTAVWYYSKPITAWYQSVCQLEQYTSEQGYLIAYATSPETLQNQWFFWEDANVANWHCRGYDN